MSQVDPLWNDNFQGRLTDTLFLGLSLTDFFMCIRQICSWKVLWWKKATQLRGLLNSVVGCERLERSTYGLRVRSSTNWANNPSRDEIIAAKSSEVNTGVAVSFMQCLFHATFSEKITYAQSYTTFFTSWAVRSAGDVMTAVFTIKIPIITLFFHQFGAFCSCLMGFWHRESASGLSAPHFIVSPQCPIRFFSVNTAVNSFFTGTLFILATSWYRFLYKSWHACCVSPIINIFQLFQRSISWIARLLPFPH